MAHAKVMLLLGVAGAVGEEGVAEAHAANLAHVSAVTATLGEHDQLFVVLQGAIPKKWNAYQAFHDVTTLMYNHIGREVPFVDAYVIVEALGGAAKWRVLADACDRVFADSPVEGVAKVQMRAPPRDAAAYAEEPFEMLGGDARAAMLHERHITSVVHGWFPIRSYKHAVVGGTFDRLHGGHKVLLSTCAYLATERVTVGVTSPVLNAKKTHSDLIDPIDKRMAEVRHFLSVVAPDVDVVTEPITDMYGPSIEVASMDVIVVSKETARGGPAVNAKRLERGLPELDILVTSLVEAEGGAKLSSTWYREQAKLRADKEKRGGE